MRFGVALCLAAVIGTWGASSGRSADQFRVPFPEGYTRAEMIERVATDVRIADAELKRANEPTRVALSAAGYAGATQHRVVPCFGNGLQKSMEGYLFPSTYFFDTITTGDNLAQAQVTAFCGELAEARPLVREVEGLAAIRRPPHRIPRRSRGSGPR